MTTKSRNRRASSNHPVGAAMPSQPAETEATTPAMEETAEATPLEQAETETATPSQPAETEATTSVMEETAEATAELIIATPPDHLEGTPELEPYYAELDKLLKADEASKDASTEAETPESSGKSAEGTDEKAAKKAAKEAAQQAAKEAKKAKQAEIDAQNQADRELEKALNQAEIEGERERKGKEAAEKAKQEADAKLDRELADTFRELTKDEQRHLKLAVKTAQQADRTLEKGADSAGNAEAAEENCYTATERKQLEIALRHRDYAIAYAEASEKARDEIGDMIQGVEDAARVLKLQRVEDALEAVNFSYTEASLNAGEARQAAKRAESTADELFQAMEGYNPSTDSIGNIKCVNNAKSPLMRCAVNPSGPCYTCGYFRTHLEAEIENALATLEEPKDQEQN